MTITIYTSQFPFTRDARARWVCEELGVRYETVKVSLLGAPDPTFSALCPTGKVPFLTDGDVSIFESGAIALYLAETYGRGALVPERGADRARVLQWVFFGA